MFKDSHKMLNELVKCKHQSKYLFAHLDTD